MADKFVFDNERLGLEYLNQCVRDGWTVTHTPNRYDTWDANITKGDRTYKAEVKVRYISEKLANQGLLLDSNKINKDVYYYWEFIPSMNAGYMITYKQIQDGISSGEIIKDDRLCSDKTYINPNKKVEKNNLLIPIELFKRFPLNCQDY